MKLRILVLSLAGVLAAAAGVRAQAGEEHHKPFDPGAPYRAPRSKTYHAIHYKLVLSFDEPKGELNGTDTVTFTPIAAELRTLDLDSAELTIERVTDLQGRALSFTTPPGKLLIDLARPLHRGETGAVVIRYHGYPHQGMHFVQPDPAYPDKVAEIWTQGEEEDNHYWFPCYDYPNDRATSEVIGTVPENQTLVSNGRLVSQTHDAARHTRTFHWKIDEPHSTYLTSITVGPFVEYEQKWEGKPVTYYVAPSVDRETALRSFGQTPDMIAFFSKMTGVAYPYAKYAQSAMDEFGGGMENISATTQTARTLHDARAELDYKSEGLVAHELAHQWFGDMVTCRSWADIWLNEGSATFWEGLWTQHHDGEDEYALEMLRNRDSYFNEDEHRYRRPIVDHRYSDPQDMFDSTTYPKGGWVQAMLRYVLGDDAFFRGIHRYLEERQWRNADTHDFERAFEEESGQNLEWFFNEWAYKAGYPEYKVTSTYEPDRKMEKVVVAQTQTVDDLTPLFTMPVVIDITTAGGRTEHRVTISEKTQTFEWGVDGAPLMVRFDPGDHVLKKIDFEKSASELSYELAHDPDVTGRIWAAGELARKNGNPDNVSPLAQALAADPFYGVRAAAGKALGAFKGNEAARKALLSALSDKKSTVRASAAEALAAFASEPAVAGALEKTLSSDRSYAAEAAAARALAKGKAAGAYDALAARLAQAPMYRTIADAIFGGFSDLRDKRALALATEWSAHGKPIEVRGAALRLMGSLGKGDEKAFSTLEGALSDSAPEVRFAAVAALGKLKDERAVAELERIAKEDAAYGVRHFAARTVRQIEEAQRASTAEKEVERLKKENTQLQEKLGKIEKGRS